MTRRIQREATCLGCGCTDTRACNDVLDGSCHWLRVDHGRGVGVCSWCPGKVEAFDRQIAAAKTKERA